VFGVVEQDYFFFSSHFQNFTHLMAKLLLIRTEKAFLYIGL
jgi:hypothetical protein